MIAADEFQEFLDPIDDETQLPWSDAVHFRAIAARIMRQILVDHARRVGALKRGGDRLRVTIDPSADIAAEKPIDILDVDSAVQKLHELDERKARVVELLFFGGLTHAEASIALGVSKKTIDRIGTWPGPGSGLCFLCE